MHGKRLGQHFLNNIHIARKIAGFAGVDDKIVVEIGAGKGMLTRELARKARRVYAIEIDTRCVGALLSRKIPKTEVIHADFLQLDMTNYAGSIIVGNIPYSITTKIIEKLVRERQNYLRAVLTIQKEYGNRVLAKPNSSYYSSLSCYVGYYFNVSKGFNISPKYFTPAPKVSSMVLSLEHRQPPFFLNDDDGFFEFVKGVFRYRRKMLKNSLFKYFGYLPDCLDANILARRPEQLDLSEFYMIYRSFQTTSIPILRN